MATLLRQRPVMVPKGTVLEAADHDWHRMSMTPSVLLHSEIPESIDESFYRGQVYVTMKNTVLKKSTAFRHVAEREKVVEEWKPIECYYSDGGPDHNPKHNSVRLAQLSHFKRKNLDMSVNVVTPPGKIFIYPETYFLKFSTDIGLK